jgi:deazaflavin-dependent oxidoreductase (nitroreductase family)
MSTYQLPRYLGPANRIVKVLNRLGLSLGTIAVISVPGRKTGKPRATPVSPVSVGGHRYVIAGIAGGDWARNARAAGHGTLSRGRRTDRVTLTEVTDHAEQVAVLRTFPIQVPHGVAFFKDAGLVAGPSPDDFESAAGKCAIFRLG